MQPNLLALAFTIFLTIISCFGLYRLTGSGTLEPTNAVVCSGNGKIYGDNPKTCDCFDGYSGNYCQIQNDEVLVNDIGGNPELHQQYWERHTPEVLQSTLVVPGDYRMGYEHFSHLVYEDDKLDIDYLKGLGKLETLTTPTITPHLNKVIRQLHKQHGNAETDGYTIVLGTGGTALISAAEWALSTIYRTKEKKPNDLVRVFARSPFFGAYRNWANMYPMSTQWNASLEQFDAKNRLIEFVTCPNNPTGKINWDSHYNSPYVVHDLVYYWDYLTNVNYKADKDIMIFSLSKLSGHAGTRFGWALVKDKHVAEQMANFIIRTEVHTSIDAQYRALHVLQHLTGPQGKVFFSYMKEKMTERWNRVLQVFAKENMKAKLSIESVPGQFYLWLKCLQVEENCYELIRKNGIIGWPGDDFGAEPGRYVRLELVVRDHAFELMMKRFEKLAL